MTGIFDVRPEKVEWKEPLPGFYVPRPESFGYLDALAVALAEIEQEETFDALTGFGAEQICSRCGDKWTDHYSLGSRKVCYNKDPARMAIITGNYFDGVDDRRQATEDRRIAQSILKDGRERRAVVRRAQDRGTA